MSWLLVLVSLLGAAAARELDPAACAARFDVQRDKIIRTEESREMGARYLSELDVGARAECRRLCCETDSCDVFVYEEKSPGSCYLFNCGPPEDFRCKFTAHGNFSSGVLALSRRLAELQDQERALAPPPPPLPPHAHNHPPPPPPSTTTTLAAPKLTSTEPPPPPPPTTTPQPQQVKSGRCSRYQWECHSGGECIAVYNACDGVPQCADGSDEAPELGCPAAPGPAPAAPPRAPAPPAPPQPPFYPPQVYEPEAAEGGGGGGGGSGGGPRWPHRLLQAQPRRMPAPAPPAQQPSDEGGVSPHIFSHKGGLMQEEPAFEPPAPAWPRRPYAAHTGLEGGTWGGWGRGEWEERRAWPAPPRDQVQEMPYLGGGGKTMPEMALLYGGGEEARAPHDAPKKGLRLEPSAPATPAARPPPPDRQDTTVVEKVVPAKTEVHESESKKPTAVVHTSSVSKETGVHSAGGGVVLAAAARRDERDGPSERPPAALLLLVLGVAMTGALGVLVGCRARAARRRRGGRGRPPHDPDYLVNGMYL